MTAHQKLLDYLRETDAFASAARLLQWDQETGMPSGGEAARANALAVLSGHLHARATSTEFAERAAAATATASTDLEKRQTELVNRDLDRARKLPARLVEELTRATSLGQQEWARARKNRDFAAFKPHLEAIVALKREEGACLAPAGGTAYDGLLSDYEWSLRTSDWETLFAGLSESLPSLVTEIVARQESSRQRLEKLPALRGPFPIETQMAVCKRLAAGIGYDFSRGRLDQSAHPFSETVHAGDSRITTRFSLDDLDGSVFSTLHETGHALYEQGLPEELAGTPLGGYCSMAVHESQSRLWENLVGRSRAYWEQEYAPLVQDFPALASVSLDDWMDHVQRVRRTLIRTESDEVTYNLHVVLRFGIEKALISGELAVADLPDAWNQASVRLLGVAPAHDGEGCLQDVHWSAGLFGYFPTYTLGNLLSAQLYAAAHKAGATADRATLLAWLRTHIHARGHALETADLIREATGEAPDARFFLQHLRDRYC